MHYKVRARFKPDTASEFRRKLLDGTIQSQKPDGPEIVASMKRAVVAEDGAIEWSEVCYCHQPLDHERRTVYDHHFEGMETEEVDSYQTHVGQPFMDYLDRVADAAHRHDCTTLF